MPSSLISWTPPSLTQGISQQNEKMRNPVFLDQQTNHQSDSIQGIKKRPPYEYIAQGSATAPWAGAAYPKVHPIRSLTDSNGDEFDALLYINAAGDTRAQKLDGTELTISIASAGVETDYLAASDPAADLRCVTLRDTTFIANRNEVVTETETDNSGDPPFTYRRFLYQITRPLTNGEAVRITLSGAPIQYTYTNTSGGVEDEQTVATGLIALLNGTPPYLSYQLSTSPKEGVFCLQTDVNTRFTEVATLSTTSGLPAITFFGEFNDRTVATVSSITDPAVLPRVGASSFYVEVRPDGDQDSAYYLQFNPDVGFSVTISDGWWKEVADPLTTRTLTNMPAILRWDDTIDQFYLGYGGDGALSDLAWPSPPAGTIENNPPPSFVEGDDSDGKINDLFFWYGRFGIVSGNDVVFSDAVDLQQFYKGSVVQSLASDPIDVEPLSQEDNELWQAVPTESGVFCTGKLNQWLISANQILSAATITIQQVGNYPANLDAKPIPDGRTIYFLSPNGDYEMLRALNLLISGDDYMAPDVTEQVPQYLPTAGTLFVGSTAESLLLYGNVTTKDSTYIYDYKDDADGRKVKSAWSDWQTVDTYALLGGAFWGDRFYGYVWYSPDGSIPNGAVFLISLDVNEETRKYPQSPWRLDLAVTGTIAADGDGAYVDCPSGVEYGTNNAQPAVSVVSNQASGNAVLGQEFQVGAAVGGDPDTRVRLDVPIPADYVGTDVTVGLTYTATFGLSEWVWRSRDGLPNLAGLLQVRDIKVQWGNTGFCQTEATSRNNTTKTRDHKQYQMGVSPALLADLKVEPFQSSVYVKAKADGLTVTFKNDTHWPSAVDSVTWRGMYTTQYRGG